MTIVDILTGADSGGSTVYRIAPVQDRAIKLGEHLGEHPG